MPSRETPEPDSRESARSRLPRLILVTGHFADPAELLRRTRLTLEGGVRWVQLRAKERSARNLYESAALLRPLTRDFDAALIVNDRVDVALASGADGVHLPGNGFSVEHARRMTGEKLLIGLSVHSREEIEAADAVSLDYVQFGPVYDTASKRAFGLPKGTTALAEAARAAHDAGLRLVAIGGIGPAQAAEIAAAGADAIGTIGAIWAQADIEAAARHFVAATAAAFPPGAAGPSRTY